jgi:hypothetical protein
MAAAIASPGISPASAAPPVPSAVQRMAAARAKEGRTAPPARVAKACMPEIPDTDFVILFGIWRLPARRTTLKTPIRM